VPIAPSTYYAFKTRARCARSLSDERRLPIVKFVHAVNFSVYGVRKMCYALRRIGESSGRDQVARLMRLLGLRGVSIRKWERRALSEAPLIRAGDPVQRDWFRDAPDVVWVADFTYMRTREGWMYVSFLQDAFSRRILGFALRSSKGAELVTRTLLQAGERAAALQRDVRRERRHCA